MTELRFHPISEVFPLLEGPAFDELVADVREHGVREPIWLHRDGRIIDGRNRYRAAGAAGREVATRVFAGSDSDLAGFVISLNLKRRHLNESQRAMAAAKLATLAVGRPKKGKFAHLPTTKQAADLVGVSERSVKTARQVHNHAAPNVISAVESGQVSVSAAAVVAKAVPRDAQKGLTVADIRRAARAVALGGVKLPSKREAIERSKEIGGYVLASDRNYHAYTTPEQDRIQENLNTLVYTILHTQRPITLSPEDAVACVPDCYVATVEQFSADNLAWLQAFRKLWEERHEQQK